MRRDILQDIVGLGGLAMAFAGLWWIYPPSALIIVGGTLFVVAVRGGGNGNPSRSP